MAELLLINPRKREKKKTKARYKKRRRMSALQRKYFGKGHAPMKKRRHHRKSVSAKRVKKLRRHSLYMTNPRHKRRKHRRHYSYRRNPIGGRFNIKSFTKDTLMPATVGAVGALGLNVVLGYLPLPLMLQTGVMRSVTKIAGAVALGMVAGAVTNRRTGEQVAAGAITVTLYDLIRGWASTAMPTLPGLSGADEYPVLSYAGAGEQVGMYVSEGEQVGMYVGEEG